MDSKYLIASAGLLSNLNVDQTANDLEFIRYNVPETKVLLEIPPGSWYYNLSFAQTRAQAMAEMQSDEWQHDPEIYGV